MRRDVDPLVIIVLSYVVLSFGFAAASIAVGFFLGAGFGFAVMAVYLFLGAAIALGIAVRVIKNGKED
mgnify:CR=1 FL=1